MVETTDSVVRAVTNDGAFRTIVACTTETVRGAVAAQGATGQTARHFGDLLTGAMLLRETMAPGLRVQCILRSTDERSRLVADSHPSGATRGLVQALEQTAEFEVGRGAVLQMMRTLQDGRVSQGLVEVPDHGTISRALMTYMQESEQVVTMLAVGTLLDDDRVISAGGYLVQLLPEAPRGALMVMTERLTEFETIAPQLERPDFSPEWLLSELLYAMPFSQLERSAVRFECWCDELRVVAALASLDRSELAELIADGETLQISCEYCGRQFAIPPARLQGLLQGS